MAPASSTGLASQCTFHGTRTTGAAPVPLVAVIMACTDSMPIGPCSMSRNSQSKPQAARTWVTCTLGIEMVMPIAGLSAARRALSGLMARRCWVAALKTVPPRDGPCGRATIERRRARIVAKAASTPSGLIVQVAREQSTTLHEPRHGRPIQGHGVKLRVDWMRLLPPGRGVARGGGRSQRLAAVRAPRGPALVREEPDDLRRLMIGQAEPITNGSQLVALFGADRAARKDPADRLLELQPPLVQLVGKARRQQAGRKRNHADADHTDHAS